MHVSSVTGATQLCIFEQWVAPEAGAPTHRHFVEEVLTAIGGEADMWIDETHVAMTCGSSLVIPAGRNHGFRNVGSHTLHIRAILASAILEASSDGGTVQRWLVPD